MRVVIDTNIAFSAILNSNSLIARIIIQPKTKLHFYSTDLLLLELHEHKDKLIQLSGYTADKLDVAIAIISKNIKFIDANLIPPNVYLATQELLKDIDPDDTEFVALTNHIHGKLWSGDKVLQKGLIHKEWNKFITSNELFAIIAK